MRLISQFICSIKGKFGNTYIQEIIGTIIVSLIIYWNARNHDLYEKLTEFLAKYEEYELDELIILIVVGAVGLVFIVHRRGAYLKEEIQLRKKAEGKIKKLAYFDTLTGLPNRDSCTKELIKKVSEAKADNTKIAIIFLDIDNFKQVNDSFGHSCGDLLLKGLSSRLSNEVKEADLISRISGDEFVIIIDGFQSESDLTLLLQRLLGAASSPFELDGNIIFTSLSIGVATYPSNGNTGNELLKNADTAMYEAKKGGKNNYSFYSEKLRKKAERRFLISQHLRHALIHNEFSLVYQPIINNKINTLKGVEILIRWNNKELGFVPPDEFIPIAEENGVIYEIDEWVLLNACKQNKAWENIGPSPIVVSVNISACQLNSSRIVKSVSNALKTYDLPPHLLELEITETVMMKDVDKGKKLLKELSELGVSLALDDFGTGYASINYLTYLKLNRLKIDKSFIKGIPSKGEEEMIYETVISLAKNLKIEVTAEGVETKEQYDYIKDTLCDYCQGYYFSKPVSDTKITELLEYSKSNPLVVEHMLKS